MARVARQVLDRLQEAALRRQADALRAAAPLPQGAPPRVRLAGRDALPEGVRVVELTHGQWAIVDESDFAEVSASKWHARELGRISSKIYAARSAGPGEEQLLHRWIVRAPRGLYVDHWNGDSLDDRRCNLRICTPAQNSFNRAHLRPGARGVRRCKSGWRATIHLGRKKLALGVFATEAEAAAAYDRAAVEMRGEFARLNGAKSDVKSD